MPDEMTELRLLVLRAGGPATVAKALSTKDAPLESYHVRTWLARDVVPHRHRMPLVVFFASLGMTPKRGELRQTIIDAVNVAKTVWRLHGQAKSRQGVDRGQGRAA